MRTAFIWTLALLVGSTVFAAEGDPEESAAVAGEETNEGVEEKPVTSPPAPTMKLPEPTTTTTTTAAPVEESADENEAPEEAPTPLLEASEETAEPANEWSTYYFLPSEKPDMIDKFNQVLSIHVNSDNPETECRENDAEFSRWYRSSENDDHAILSYYCKTQAVRGYEHLKVSLSKLNVLEFHSSLKGFGIMDAGGYEQKLSEDDAAEVRAELLPQLIDQLAEQRKDDADQSEICPDPGTETFAEAMEKYENELYYYKIKISCNETVTESGIPSHYSEIEVVTDRDFKVLNEGKPVLVTMEPTQRNTWFIEKEDMKKDESMKQVDGVSVLFPGCTSIVTLTALLLLQRLV